MYLHSELELVLLLAAADQREEHVHLNQNLQHYEHGVNNEKRHAHSLGQPIATTAEDDEQCNGR